MEIYEPEEDSFLLREVVEKYAFGRVLDMGTGSGIQAIAAAKKIEVREVVAVDFNSDAVKELKKRNIPKIKANKSNLFSAVKGLFDTIIFNPPYLPDDSSDQDVALDGGRTGVELIDLFLSQAKSHLSEKGFILLLFSNRTEGCITVIEKNNYSYNMLSKKSLPFFEELYVYKLSSKKSREVFAKGKRGIIYREGDICIKMKNPDAKKDSLANEAKFLKLLNKKNIGPKFISFDGVELRREFIDGMSIEEYFESCSKKAIVDVIGQVLMQCRELDKLKINKTELTNPYKDILVTSDNKAVLIDFERCKMTKKPQNVTQFLQYIAKKIPSFKKKKINLNRQELIDYGKEYKHYLDDKSFLKIISLFS